MKIKGRKFEVLFLILIIFSIGLIYAENIGIEIIENKELFVPGEEINFKVTLYDNNTNKIDGEMSFEIQDYYADIINQGKVNSGEKVNFIISDGAYRGNWRINVYYNEIRVEEWFNVGELEKAEIRLERDQLIIKNIGNVVYGKPISISIGEHYETALVGLEIGQTKIIRLTAPEGEYNVKISDGTEDNTFETSGVSLTGNVVGLESVFGGGFWKRYPMVSVFLGVILLIIIIIFGLKAYKNFSK